MKKYMILILLFLIPEYSHATSLQILRLPVGARQTGMGGAGIGMDDETTAIYWNPAGLTSTNDKTGSLMHVNWFGGMTYEVISVTKERDNGYFGLGVEYFSAGGMLETDVNNNELGNFSPFDLCISLGMAKVFNTTPLGMTVKYIYSKLKDADYTFAADIGTILSIAENTSLGITLRNVGGAIKYYSVKEQLPLCLAAGVSYNPGEDYYLNGDLSYWKDIGLRFSFGAEYNYKYTELINLSLRMGFNNNMTMIRNATGITFGFSAVYDKKVFDYAFLPAGDLGNCHYITLTKKF